MSKRPQEVNFGLSIDQKSKDPDLNKRGFILMVIILSLIVIGNHI